LLRQLEAKEHSSKQLSTAIKSQGARTKALADFKTQGKVKALVATDIAARKV